MIQPADFVKTLKFNNLGPVVEVPCSYLKDLFNYLWESKEISVINPVNEAIAMGIASGFYLGSGKIPVIAIQNSGFMNTLNALTSLNQIYKIPVFYIVTWRGEGGKGRDAPEHDIIGANLLKILKSFKLSYEIASDEMYPGQIAKLTQKAQKTKKPVVLVIRKSFFADHNIQKNSIKDNAGILSRLEAITVIKKTIGQKALYISSTGFPTRYSFASTDTPDFYMVGSMGHTFAVGLGVAININKKVVIFDGDGSALMHIGGLASIDTEIHHNLIYIVLDNQIYESTGGQPNRSININYRLIARAFSFPLFFQVDGLDSLKNTIQKALTADVPSFIHIAVGSTESRASQRVSDKYSCQQIKIRFMRVASKSKKRL